MQSDRPKNTQFMIPTIGGCVSAIYDTCGKGHQLTTSTAICHRHLNLSLTKITLIPSLSNPQILIVCSMKNRFYILQAIKVWGLERLGTSLTKTTRPTVAVLRTMGLRMIIYITSECETFGASLSC